MEDDGQVQEFFIELLKYNRASEKNNLYQRIQKCIQENDPKIKILIGAKNHIEDGFICVNAKSPIKNTLDFIAKSLDEAISSREDVVLEDALSKMRLNLEKKFCLKFIDLQQEEKDQE